MIMNKEALVEEKWAPKEAVLFRAYTILTKSNTMWSSDKRKERGLGFSAQTWVSCEKVNIWGK